MSGFWREGFFHAPRMDEGGLIFLSEGQVGKEGGEEGIKRGEF